MKTKKLNFKYDFFSETHVYVVMSRWFGGEWNVLFVESDKQSAFDFVCRIAPESYREIKVVETELY